MRLDEKWIRTHLPPDCADESIDIFSGYYLDGLTVMSEGERGGSDTAVYRAKSEDDLRYWQLENICHFVEKPITQKSGGTIENTQKKENGFISSAGIMITMLLRTQGFRALNVIYAI